MSGSPSVEGMTGMTPNDIGSLIGVDEVRLSPDGTQVAFTVVAVDFDENEYRRSTWRHRRLDPAHPLHRRRTVRHHAPVVARRAPAGVRFEAQG